MDLNTPDLLGQFKTSLVKDNVGVVEFAEKHCGKLLYPRQKTLLKIIFLEELDDYDLGVIKEWESGDGEVKVCPDLTYRLDYLRKNGYPHFRTIQLVGGRRSSKGFLTGLIIAYKVYRLIQLDNPGTHYGIDKAKDIYFSVVAASLDQAKAMQFDYATGTLLECKPLKDQGLINKVLAETFSVYTPYDKRKMSALASAGVKPDKDLATIKVKAFGTNSKTIRGSASILFAFDEMAHIIGGESRMSDEELFKASIPSLAQFRKDAMILANSSPYTKTGKFFELYEQALEIDETTGVPAYPDHFMLQYPSWELYKDWDKHPGKYTGALINDPVDDPILAREERADPESFKVEYRAQFAEVVDAFLRPEMVDRLFSAEYAQEILGKTLTPTTGAVGFMRYKGHADPSAVDANFGIAIAHTEPVFNEELGIEEQHVVFDYINAFYPEDFPEHTIDWQIVIPELVQLINNYRPFEFTFDQFDSTMPIQEITRQLAIMGVGETMVHEKTATADRNLRRAKNFKAAINLGRVHAPHPSTYTSFATKNPIELVMMELKFLQQKITPAGTMRIEKQSIGPVQTKDIADCMMECVDALIGDSIMSISEELARGTLATGAPGGYRIGGHRMMGNTDTFPEVAQWYPFVGQSPKGQAPHMPWRGDRRRGRH